MPSKRKKLAALVIAMLWSAAPAIAHAQSRQADLAPEGRTLEPRPDGSYFLPVPGMESMTLRFEPGEMPIELVALRIDEERDSLVADLRYVGEKVVTGWQVKTASVNSVGRETSSTLMGTDWRTNGDPVRDHPVGYRAMAGSDEIEGAIRPGEVRAVDLGSATAPDLAELVLSVPLLVFEDASYLGSDRLARDMLENRSMGAEERARWLERLTGILDSTSDEWELTRALEELVTEMEAVSDLPLRPNPNMIRDTLERNLRNILSETRSSRSHSTQRDQIRELIDFERHRLESMIEHVPEELPEDHEPPRRLLQKNIEEGPGDDPSGDGGVEDCDCGGSITDNVVRNQTIQCGPQMGWTVDESWQLTCLNENGGVTGNRSADLHGFGACIDDGFCLDATSCPPEFHGPTITEVETERRWHRWVRNKRVLVGLCSGERCGVVSLSSVERTCNCAPMPRPRCFADGCPILIETGNGGFTLTDAADGVDFDLVGHGVPSRVAWTEPGGDDAWLVLDRNGDGRIDDATELFGDRTPQPPAGERHGFLALALFDQPAHGGDGDGWIGAGDAVFDDLRLWLDHDHDGVSDLGELIPLASADIEAIGLDFFRSQRRDRHGNRFRYSARVRLASGGHRLATDVFLQFE